MINILNMPSLLCYMPIAVCAICPTNFAKLSIKSRNVLPFSWELGLLTAGRKLWNDPVVASVTKSFPRAPSSSSVAGWKRQTSDDEIGNKSICSSDFHQLTNQDLKEKACKSPLMEYYSKISLIIGSYFIWCGQHFWKFQKKLKNQYRWISRKQLNQDFKDIPYKSPHMVYYLKIALIIGSYF
jgi:hypothetical protein